MIAGANAIFQELAGVGLLAIAATLLTGTALWIIVEQNERSRKEQRYVSPEFLGELLKNVGEIRDRGYDTVDRLERIEVVNREIQATSLAGLSRQ